MTSNGEKRSPEERVADHERVLSAMRDAVREAILRHKQAGVPMVVWRDGRVEWISADSLTIETALEGLAQTCWSPSET